MQIKSGTAHGALYIKLIGEMDEYSAQSVREKCDKLIEDNLSVKKIIINLSEVAFMDSTGIGFLIGRYKKAARRAYRFMWKPPISRLTKYSI